MKLILLLLTMSLSVSMFAQTSDEEIVKTLFLHNVSVIEPALDSLGVYYHFHLEKYNNNEEGRVIVSIADTCNYNTLKLYTIKTSVHGIPMKIVVNYRHDNYQHMLDLDRLPDGLVKHVGTYSTDVFFVSPKKSFKRIVTREFQSYESAKQFANKLPERSIYFYNMKYYYVGIVLTEDDKFVRFVDGKSVLKDKLLKIN